MSKNSILSIVFLYLAIVLAAACSGEESPADADETGGDGDSDGDGDGDADGDGDGDADGDGDGDADGDGAGDGDTDADGDTDPYSDIEADVVDPGEPLPDAEEGRWKWIPIEGAMCRNGSAAGVSVRYNGNSDDVMLFLEGGGACFNMATCSSNPSSVISEVPPMGGDTSGIFDLSNGANPFKNFSTVYVPYCTGDIHGGSRKDVSIAGVVGKQQFVGGDNFRLILSRVLATFPDAENFVLAGYSGGAMGVNYNMNVTAQSVKDAMGDDVRVVVLADASVVMRDEYLPKCLQVKVAETWGLSKYMPPGCEGCDPTDGGSLHKIYGYMAKNFPDVSYSFISAYGDIVMRSFFGYGNNNCKALIPTYSADKYRDGLMDIIAYLTEHDWGGSYLFDGTDHGRLYFDSFYTANVRETSLTEWSRDLLNDNLEHIAE